MESSSKEKVGEKANKFLSPETCGVCGEDIAPFDSEWTLECIEAYFEGESVFREYKLRGHWNCFRYGVRH